jgi:hypothetical protein
MRTVLIGLLTLCVASVASARDITGCHDAVLSGDTGVLQNDLDCGGADFGRWGVTLTPGATLDLNGYAIRNEFGGVWCQGKCTIMGPGEITGMEALAVLVNDKTVMRDVVIRDSGAGIYPTDVAGDLARLERVRVGLRNVTLIRTGSSGVYGWKIKVIGVTVVDSGFGLYADRVGGRDVTVTGNAENGIRATNVKLTNLVATDNGAAGVEALYMRLKDSTVTGNDGYGDGRDVIGLARGPLLINTTCGRSAASDLSDYDICTND